MYKILNNKIFAIFKTDLYIYHQFQKFFLSFFLFLIFLFSFSYSFDVETYLEEKEYQIRSRNLFFQVKCIVCEGQTIENSSSNFAIEIKNLIRKQILIGKSDNDIKKDLVRRYGNEVLIYNKVKPYESHFLWLFPLVIFILSLFIFCSFFKKPNKKFLRNKNNSF